MVKQTQKIRRQKATICLSVLDHHVGLALKVLEKKKKNVIEKKKHMSIPRLKNGNTMEPS